MLCLPGILQAIGGVFFLLEASPLHPFCHFKILVPRAIVCIDSQLILHHIPFVDVDQYCYCSAEPCQTNVNQLK